MREAERRPKSSHFASAERRCLFGGALVPERPAPFLACVRYHVSDHRRLWAEFRT